MHRSIKRVPTLNSLQWRRTIFFFYVAQFSFSNLLMITFNAPFVQSIAAAMTHFPPQGSLKFNFTQSKNSPQNVFACKWQLQRSVIALISVRFMSRNLSDTFPGKPISLLAKQTDAGGGGARLRRLLGNLGAREEEAKRVFTSRCSRRMQALSRGSQLVLCWVHKHTVPVFIGAFKYGWLGEMQSVSFRLTRIWTTADNMCWYTQNESYSLLSRESFLSSTRI